MKINDIFLKAVDRPIEGVIKADDNSNLKREVEEYVVTDEVSTKLGSFLDAYLSKEASNGVWISGFFGSGKSHLLKMLSLLLQNWTEDDFSILTTFTDKCKGDVILCADLKKAVAIPSKSILFNIDQKADIVAKTQTDALLSVFIKVFDEFCGYYGKQGYIAKFERDLDKKGIYQSFQDTYKTISGKDWSIGREESIFESHNISLAFTKVTGSEANNLKNILDKYREDYRVSIEDFAIQVFDYIKTQDKDFRLNFFVDEVGQYIAENTKLMLNLQTIAESLATICKGRAWVVVTSQEDLDAVLGELNKHQGNDFSKIQARFATRLSLTSANVGEVIQKRLLQKKDESIDLLSELYHLHVNNFKTMFHFVDGAQTFRNFNNKEDFIYCYPFIPYQFSLFQKAIKSLSLNQAFEGTHSSVGERSMLGVFQHVVKSIVQSEIGNVATFDLMFDGIRSSIKSQIQGAIINAENNLGNVFATRVLKILFMLKYVKDFKATVRNVSILLLDSFETDINELRKQIDEALILLETQTYIQRNGELYEFLTNEEKNVEQEIKNTQIDNMALFDELDKVLFSSGQIVKSLKIRYEENKQDFQFTRRIDYKQSGKEHEITIHVVTPSYEFYDLENDKQLIAHSLGKPELTVVIPADKRFWDDLGMYIKTEKCFQQTYSSMQNESTRKILSEKQHQNKDRALIIKTRLTELIIEAKLYAGGDALDIDVKDANTRIVQGFQTVVSKVYPNLRMLKGVSYSEQDIIRYLDTSQITADYAAQLTEAEQEVFSHITANSRIAKRTTLNDVMDKFSHKPYGWGFYAILCQIAKLYSNGKVEVYADGVLLENSLLDKALKNTAKHSSMILQPQQEYTPSQVRRLKDLYNNLFDAPPSGNDVKALAKETGETLAQHTEKLEKLIQQKAIYSFTQDLAPITERFKEAKGKPYNWFYSDFVKHDDEFVQIKAEIIDPILAFMSGNQKSIYDSIRMFLSEQESNLAYLNHDDINRLKSGFTDSECYKGNRMQQLKPLLDILQDKLSRIVETEKNKALNALTHRSEEITTSEQFQVASDEIKASIDSTILSVQTSISSATIIAVIKDLIRRFEEVDYPLILIQLKGSKEPINDVVKEKSKRIDRIDIPIAYHKTDINNIEELNQYIEAVKKAYLDAINDGNSIKL